MKNFKEKDIRDVTVLNHYLELVVEDSKKIFKDKSTFVTNDCPACLSNNLEVIFKKNGFQYVQCKECKTFFVNPRPRFDHLMNIYKDSPSTKFWVDEFFTPKIENRRDKIFRPRAEDISSKLPTLYDKKIGDIGAGFGLFIEELRKIWPNANLIAIEPSEKMAKICINKNIHTLECALEDLSADQNNFDLLTSFELIEHLHNAETFLKNVHSILKKGAYFYFTTLNGLGFDIQVLWENSKSVFPPHHLNFFNVYSIRILLERVGFEVIEVKTPGVLDWNIVESQAEKSGITLDRFFESVKQFASETTKNEFQIWLQKNQLSSHMRVLVKKS